METKHIGDDLSDLLFLISMPESQPCPHIFNCIDTVDAKPDGIKTWRSGKGRKTHMQTNACVMLYYPGSNCMLKIVL